ncbi:MAG TPA: aldose 1-epimerase [Hanamia sp.]|nr:aldose 1-epimerase [Hanamia sp.]
MFTIQKKKESGFDKIILQNDETKNYAAVAPACGAVLLEFVVEQNNVLLNVIDGYKSADEFKNQLAERGFKGCKLSPFVCRLNQSRFTFADKEYVIEKQKSSPNKHAIHGLIYDKSFEVISETANDKEAAVTMKYEYREDDPGYPFNYDCIVTWRLEKNNKLTVITECVNKDEGLIPIQDGWHPYFTLGDTINNLDLEFQSLKMVEFNTELLPTKKLIDYTRFTTIEKLGDRFLDNCFVLDSQECQPLCVLRNADKKIEVQLMPDESYPYLQVYTPPHRKSIAIENLSGAPDGFNNNIGVTTLESGQSSLFKTSYKIVLLN